jgi:hypothetical protein
MRTPRTTKRADRALAQDAPAIRAALGAQYGNLDLRRACALQGTIAKERRFMLSAQAERRVFDRVTLAVDALVLTVAAGAVLIIKRFANIPAPWIDFTGGFQLTITLAAVVGAVVAWLLHRNAAGSRGLMLLAAGVVVAIAVILGVQAAVDLGAQSMPGLAPTLGTVTQAAGLAGLLALIWVIAVNLVRPGRRRFSPMALARLAALVVVASYIAFRFLPETAVDSVAAPFYAIFGYATIQGPLGVVLADVAQTVMARRPLRNASAPEAEAGGTVG